jgi:hypothetical protein
MPVPLAALGTAATFSAVELTVSMHRAPAMQVTSIAGGGAGPRIETLPAVTRYETEEVHGAGTTTYATSALLLTDGTSRHPIHRMSGATPGRNVKATQSGSILQ